MNYSSSGQRTGGASITPSARPSIHSHWSCPFAKESMVRYGLDKDTREESADLVNEQGVDEVDNVMSKPVNPIRSPSRQNDLTEGSRNRKNRHRRNSLHTEYKEFTEDDDHTNVLSKSVPATLPSHLNYSDDSDDNQILRNEYQLSDVSYHSIGTPNRSNINMSSSYMSTPHFLDSTQIHSQRKQLPAQSNSSKITVLSLLVVLVTVCASMMNTSNMVNVSNYDEFQFYTDISGLGEKYNVDENSILQVQSGISTIFERQDTGSFMFVYNSNTDDFNPSEFNKFVNDVSYAASKYLRNDSTPVHYTMVESTKLDMEEHSELICRYREDLDKTGVMLVRHVEALPSALAMAFHYYCDEYNPLVKKSAIFFTLNLAKCPQESDTKSLHAVIEKCLVKKWSSIPPDSIRPLLTRVVSVVIDVTNAF